MGPTPASSEPRDPVGEQLSDLDQILAAIAAATNSLEQTYRQHVTGPGEVSEESGESRTED